MRRWIVECLLPCLVMAILVSGILAVGQWSEHRLPKLQVCTLLLNDVSCVPPPGVPRREFLAEVQYLANLPDQLSGPRADLPARLAAAFSQHPWVEQVRCITLQPIPGSERRVQAQVELSNRRPVLAIRMPTAPYETITRANDLPVWRAVDANGVLLPQSASCAHLPILAGPVPPPTGAPGYPWGDQAVEQAARTAAYLMPYLDQLQLHPCTIEVVLGELRLKKTNVCVLWGHAPGEEARREAPAAVKLDRLLELQHGPGGLTGQEHDVRLRAHNAHFPLLACSRP